MKALVYHGPDKRSLDNKPKPVITAPTDAIVRITNPLLLKTVALGKIQPGKLITHHFTLEDAIKAYDTFGDAMKERALKVIITNELMMEKMLPAIGYAQLEKQSLKEQLVVNDSLGG